MFSPPRANWLRKAYLSRLSIRATEHRRWTLTPFWLPFRKTGRLLIVEETFAPCSIAAEIAARVADCGFDSLDAPIRRLNGAFAPTPYSPVLEKAVIPGRQNYEAIRNLIKE